MHPSPGIHESRGTGWVLAQFVLMTGLLASAPVWCGHWPGAWSWILTVALAVVGAWAGIRGARDLGASRTPFPRPKANVPLVTAGIYSHVRHPLYLSVGALGLAWSVGWRSWPALALALVQILFLNAKSRREERWLRERFPQYAAYALRVKRFIPGIY